MKYIYIILGIIVCVSLSYFPINLCIEKRAQLIIEEDSIKYREEAIHNLEKAFEGKGYDYKGTGGFGCLLYHNYNPNFVSTSLHELGNPYDDEKTIDLLQLDEVKKLYRISYSAVFERTDMRMLINTISTHNYDIGERNNLYMPLNGLKKKATSGIRQSGWAIGFAQKIDEESYRIVIVHPLLIGSFMNSMSEYEISDAVESALNYYLTNKKSQYYGFVNDKSVFDFMKLALRNVGSRLYHFEIVDSVSKKFHFPIDYVTCNSNRIYITSSYERIYKLQYNNSLDSWCKQNYIMVHRNNLIKIISIIICILFCLLILLLTIIIKKHKKDSMSILQRIIILCNPKKYIKHYDETKLRLANDIYSKAITTDETDETTIMELASRAEKELGVSLVSENDINNLKSLCNPKKFMKPYDAQKVERANALFGELSQGVVHYSDFAKIKEKISLLYKEN